MVPPQRGQSEVIGVVLLLGISTFIVGTTLLWGGAAVSDYSSATASENALNSISHVESEVSTVSVGDADTRRVGLSKTSEGIYYVDPTAGSVTITHTDNGTEQWNVTRQLGAIVYNGSQRDAAYQGGGVWMKQDGFTNVVSSPEYYYQDSSLTFPIVQIRAPSSEPVTYGNVLPTTELESKTLDFPLENGTVDITVQSQYYQGWHQFFTDRTEGESTIHHSNNTASTRLVVPDEYRLSNTVTVATEYDGGTGNPNEPIVLEDELDENVPLGSADSLIAAKLSTAAATNDNSDNSCVDTSGIDGGCTLTAGTYYIDGDVDLSDDLTLDVSAGNITIATDGSFDSNNNEVRVEGDSENQVKYYMADSLELQGNGKILTASGADATQNQFFVGDGFVTTKQGGGTAVIEAVIYAPDADVELNGNFEIWGAVLAYDFDPQGSGTIRRGDLPENYVLDVTGTEDTVEFIHVTTNRVEAQLQNNDVFVSSYTPTTSYDCPWVATAIEDTGDVEMSDVSVGCDVTQGVDTETTDVDVTLDLQSVLVGNIDTDGDVSLSNSQVVGSVTTSSDTITLASDSIVTGDVVAPAGTAIDIGGGSTVEGAVAVKGGSLQLSDSTIDGHVYVTDDDLVSCSNMELGPDGQSCDAYDFRDPAQY